MAGMQLDDIRRAADEKYGPYVIEGVEGGPVTLLNPIRLSKEKRANLTGLQRVQEDPAADHDRLLRDMVRIVAESTSDAERLLEEIGDDNAVLAELLNAYGRAVQPGEASPSPS